MAHEVVYILSSPLLEYWSYEIPKVSHMITKPWIRVRAERIVLAFIGREREFVVAWNGGAFRCRRNVG